MAKAKTSITSVEDTIALAKTTIDSFIDDFWTSIAASHTPTAIELRATITLNMTNGVDPKAMSPIGLYWYEDAAVQNTRMKNIWDAFLTGLSAVEAASTYTTVNSISYTIHLEVTY
jgi:hypothetical protein